MRDDRDVGAWEYLVWTLAQRACIHMPPARKLKIGSSGYHTFCVQRFDLNPDHDKDTHVLNLDESDSRPSLDHVRATANYYRLPDAIRNTKQKLTTTYMDLIVR